MIAQWGLGAYARRDDIIAKKAADWLVAHQAENGGFPLTVNHDFPHPKGYRLKAPWYSAVTQGNAMSLLSRLYKTTGDVRYRDAAVRALKLLTITVPDGGLVGTLNGRPWYEETPDPNFPNHIFNGSVFALLGAHDVWLYTGSELARQIWLAGKMSLRANLNAHIVWEPYQQAGLPSPWMVYDLQVEGVPEIPTYVTDFYMKVHIQLLREMATRTNSIHYTEAADALQLSLDRYVAPMQTNVHAPHRVPGSGLY